ncbi:MAG TPA: 30S ribosomal protein S5 [Candidatus Paceibacterota bacterium]|nr:30S ribosomal protein S5 [Candidatus Paceibacterota bacterium]
MTNKNIRSRGRGRPQAAPSEYEQKILDVRRVTRVVAGGKRFNFSVLLAIGDKKGQIGLGLGKAADMQLAISKAFRHAKKNLIKLSLNKNNSIPFDTLTKFGSAKVFLRPNRGRGIVAGSVVRDILNLSGIHDVTSKIISGTKNKLNISRATMKALSNFI